MFTFNSCSEDDYTEKYTDPNKVTTLLMDKVMAGIFKKSEDNFAMGYNRFYSFDNLYLANFTQSFGRPYSNTMYYNGWSDTGEGKYSSFFSATGLFKKIELMYNELSDAEKPAYEAYYIASKTHLYCYMLAMLDTYGDLPFTEGGMVAATGEISRTDAHFDKAEDLYKLIIDEMKTVGSRFGQLHAAGSKPKDFTSTQDFINNADFSKWQKYANSLRLRAAMRVAQNGTLASVGQAAVKEILENPTAYPVVETNAENIKIENINGGPVWVSNQQGFDEGDGSNNCASDDMISRMLSDYDRATWSGTYQDGIDDPRVPLMYDLSVLEPRKQIGYPSYTDEDGKVITPEGRAVPTVFRGHSYEISDAVLEGYTSGAKGISLIRHNGLFWNNQEWDHQIISAAEMWFCKAEAFQRGWASGDAKAAFKEGIKQSIDLVFTYHEIRTSGDDDKGIDGQGRRGWVINPNRPTDAWIDQFAEDRWNAPINATHPYTDKIDAIITQKYLNYSIFYVREAWSDIRRTGYPSGLYFPTVSDALRPNVPVRLRYPAGERDYNKNFSEVNRAGFNADDYYTKLFWAK
jgi:hypothetical protein